VDMSKNVDVLKPPETVYTLQKAQDELASCIASIGGDPRRAATTSEIMARCGETEHSKNFRDFTAEERVNAMNVAPALEERMQKVKDAYREVHARRARMQQQTSGFKQQRPEASARSASEPRVRPQSRGGSPRSGNTSVSSKGPEAAGLLRKKTATLTDLLKAPALAAAVVAKETVSSEDLSVMSVATKEQVTVSVPPSSVPSIVPTLKDIVDAYRMDGRSAQSAPTAVVTPTAWAVAPESVKSRLCGAAPSSAKTDTVGTLLGGPPLAAPQIKESNVVHGAAEAGTVSEGRPSSAELSSPSLDKKVPAAGCPPSIIPQIKAMLAAYENNAHDAAALSEGAASTRSGSSTATSRSLSSNASSGSAASHRGLKRVPSAAKLQRSRSAGAVRAPTYQPPLAAHLAALDRVATHLAALDRAGRCAKGRSASYSGASAIPTKSTSSKSRDLPVVDGSSSFSSSYGSTSCSGSSGRIPRGAAYMPFPLRGVAGIALR